jgi:hypothetical protein
VQNAKFPLQWSVLSHGKLRFPSLTPARGVGLIPTTLVLTLILASSAFGQVPAGSDAPASPAHPGNALNEPSSQNQSATNGNVAGSPQQTEAANEKSRLAVNPVTGMATSLASNYKPLTGKERWKLYWKQNYLSIGAYFGPVFTALVLDQTTNSPSQWGGGPRGYGLRLASRTGSSIIQGTVQAPVAALLHEDVRYIYSGQHGFKRRTLHAIIFSFVTYNNEGHITPNVANLSAYYASTAISTTWLPGPRSRMYTLSNGSEQIALAVPVNFLQEFWPEIVHTVRRQHSP